MAVEDVVSEIAQVSTDCFDRVATAVSSSFSNWRYVKPLSSISYRICVCCESMRLGAISIYLEIGSCHDGAGAGTFQNNKLESFSQGYRNRST